MPLRASTSTFMSTDTDLSESDLTLLASSASSPALSLFEVENRFCDPNGSVREPRIDSTFKRIKSFEGNMCK